MHFLVQPRNRFRLAANDLWRPSIPRLVSALPTQGAEQNVVFKPPMVLAAEVLVTLRSRPLSREQKSPCGLTQKWQFVSATPPEVNRRFAIRCSRNPLAINQTAIRQALQ